MIQSISESVRQAPDALLDEQRRALLSGMRPSIVELLEGTPFADDPEAQLDLLYNEVVVLEQLGAQPTAAEYAARYPHLQADIELHFEIHRAVSDRPLLDTSELAEATDGQGNAEVHAGVPAAPGYVIGELLGQGAMADVYRARHQGLRRDVALKFFGLGALLGATRIRTEAEAIARLAHPHIIQIYDVGEHEGVPYLALELAEQGTLARKLQRFPFAPAAAAELICSLAEAVQHAHSKGVVHRDLKPANVLITADGVAKISDFGLAKIFGRDVEAGADVTRTGDTLGTPRYMAPEQASGDRDQIGPATDIYALGVLLYECLTGRAPFVAAGVAETLYSIRRDDPPPPRRWQPAIPRDLETICLQCLQKSPEARYASAQSLADDLRRFLRREPIHARATPLWERGWKWCRRKPAQAALVAWVTLASLSSLTAAIVLPQVENRRVNGLRQQVATLMADGRAALDRDDTEQAEAKFAEAWRIVQAESALSDHSTGVTGWLDHARNESNRYRWQQRVPPRAFDDRRDEALLLGLLVIDGIENPVEQAEHAIEAALDLTIAGDPRWQSERSKLLLLQFELQSRATGAADVLAALDASGIEPSRTVMEFRARLLDEAGQSANADSLRSTASQFPANAVKDRFWTGMCRVREANFTGAAGDFEQVLRAEPEHFTARLFHAVCCLHLDRPAEANVALTACIAQRPYFAWNFYFRALSELAVGNRAAAAEDLHRAIDSRPSDVARHAASVQLGMLEMPETDRLEGVSGADAIAESTTREGGDAVREIAGGQTLTVGENN